MIFNTGRLLVVTLFFLPTVYSAKNLTPDDKKVIILQLNSERRSFAKDKNIANMHLLAWDEDLAALANEVECKVGGKKLATDSKRLIVISKQMIMKYKDQLLKLSLTEESEPLYRGAEILHPVQTKVGCEKADRCSITLPDTKELVQIDYFCFMGPHATPMSYHKKDGQPGSACGSLKVDDGMCVPEEPEELLLGMPKMTFIIVAAGVGLAVVLILAIAITAIVVFKRRSSMGKRSSGKRSSSSSRASN